MIAEEDKELKVSNNPASDAAARATKFAQNSLKALEDARIECAVYKVAAACNNPVIPDVPANNNVAPVRLVMDHQSAGLPVADEFYDEDSLDEDSSADELMEIDDITLSAAQPSADNRNGGRRLSAFNTEISFDDVTTLAFGSADLAI